MTGTGAPTDRLLRGAGVYSGDRRPEGALWMQIVRSDVATGRILAIDTEEARAMPGARVVLTGADEVVAALDAFPVRYRPEYDDEGEVRRVRVLATDTVRYVGEPVAAVIAETRDATMDAAEAALVEIEDCRADTVARSADGVDAPRVWPGGNHVFRQELGHRVAYDSALRDAAHVFTARLEISCVTATPLEARGALAVPTETGATLYPETQATHRVRAEASHVLRVPPESLRIVTADGGGSFGMRNACYPTDVLAILAARETGHPVLWEASRLESFLSDAQSRPQSVEATLALDADLRFVALGLDGWAEVGAYCKLMSVHAMTSSLPALAGYYRTAMIQTVMRGMAVDRMHMALYRGAGRPEAIYVIERMVDIAAAGWEEFESRRAEAPARGRLRGLGPACAIEPAGARSPHAQLQELRAFTLDPDGGLTIRCGSGDTEAVPQGGGTFGSHTMVAAEQALSDAADALIAGAKADAAGVLGLPEAEVTFTDGAFRAEGTNAFVPLHDLAQRTGCTYSGEAFTMSKTGTFPNGVHLAEVEIDPETGATELVRYTVFDDVATIIDPEGLTVQTHGGVAQGLGQTFGERVVYDAEAALLSGSLMDFALPRAADLPMMELHHSPTETRANAVDAKGARESGVVSALAAEINTFHNAPVAAGLGIPRHARFPTAYLEGDPRHQARRDDMTKVAVIGAGPVGTSQALALLRAGFDVTLFEREPTLPSDPRAATIQPPTLAMVAELGSGARILERGIKAPVFQFRDRGSDEVIAEYDYGFLEDETPYPFALQCEQFKVALSNVETIEEIAPGAVRLGTEVTGFTQDADGVTLETDGPNGHETHRVDYLVGCDGGRSPTRKTLGIAFEGFTYEERFLVLTTPHDFETRGFRIRNYVLDPKQWCALFKVPHEGPPGLWRTVFPAAANGDGDGTATLSDDYVRTQIQGLEPSLTLDDIQHRNLYAVNQRVAAAFHAGRVFLAGDSAHVNNPLGGLGMNSGIHDAINLAGKLAAARDRPGDAEALFNAYTAERRGIARDYVQAQTIQNKKRLEARTPEARAAAMAELRATAEDPARHRAWVMNASLIKGLRELEAAKEG